jgi:NADPH-dependent ferric siderophore reductase
MTTHVHQMLRHPIKFRTLQVNRVDRLTPHMQRVVFASDELADFVSASPDDHVKLFFPNRDGDIVTPVMGDNGPEYPPGRDYSPMRDYTPRHHDASRRELTIDFVLHGDGPASRWAAQAAVGQRVGAGGPRGSFLVANDFDRYVLIGDETALPAIGRWLAEMPAGMRADVLVEIPDAGDRQTLPTSADVTIRWLKRDGAPAESSTLLENAMQRLSVAPGDTFYWIAAESRRARAMRIWLSQQRQLPKDWVKAKGYWKAGPDEEDDGA